MKTKYDIFISYRRVGGFESANLIAEKLRGMGYSVFFDLESLRSGKFNDQLYKVIEECKDFVVVLPENGLDRCSNEDGSANEEDWIRKEVTHAMARGKNIVPVMLAGFQWPETMPKGMESLKDYQSVTATNHEVFDLAMQRLAGYLKSKPNRFRMLKLTGLTILALAVVTAFVYGGLIWMSRSICTSVANEYALGMGIVYEAREDEEALKMEWNEFHHNYTIAKSETRRKDCEEDMIGVLNHTKKGIDDLRQQIRPMMELSEWQTFLLGLHKSQKEDVQSLPVFVTSYMDDLDSLICVMRRTIEIRTYKPSEIELIHQREEFYESSVNMMYYSYLQEITKLPESCWKSHYMLSKSWNLLPNVSLSLSQEEYEMLANNEVSKMEAISAKMEQNIRVQDNEMYDLEQRMDTLGAIADAFCEILTPESNGNAERLNAAQERVNTKRELVEQKKAELAEESQKVKDVYEQLKQNCTLKADDSEGYQWGKIRRMAKFLSVCVSNQKNAQDMAIIKPTQVYTDLCKQLDAYQGFHPEAKAYIPSAKKYYKLIADGKRKLGGQIIFAFKDDASHPLYRVGDIVVTRNGRTITDYSSLSDAVASNKKGTVEFLRMENGTLTLHKEEVPESSILVGYMEVGEY